MISQQLNFSSTQLNNNLQQVRSFRWTTIQTEVDDAQLEQLHKINNKMLINFS